MIYLWEKGRDEIMCRDKMRFNEGKSFVFVVVWVVLSNFKN